MNILFVSNNSREATILTFELTKKIPSVQLNTVFDTQDALKELQSANSFEAVVLDSSVSSGDCSILTEAARNGKKTARVLFLLEPDTQEVPRSLQDIGVDRFIPKRPGYGSILAESLSPAQEAPRPGPTGKSVRKIRVLYVGREAEDLSQYLKASPHIGVTQIPMTPDGMIKFTGQGDAHVSDIIVIDSEMTGSQTMNAFKTAVLKAPETPAIVLVSPGDEDTSTRAMRAGAAACIEKSGNYFQKLLPVIEKEILVRDLAREKEIFKTRGSRLRQIVESLPVGVAQIAPSGTFLAINQAGMRILGAGNLNQVAGKNLLQMAPGDEREKILAFLSTVTGWKGASIQIAWKGLDGSASKLELRGTPLLRDAGGAACVLTTIHVTSSAAAFPGKNEDLQQKCDSLTQSLKSYETQFKELQSRFAASEERCRLLEMTQQDMESAGLSEAERVELDAVRQDLEAKLQASEESNAELKTKLKEKEEQLTVSEEAFEQTESRLTQKEQEIHAKFEEELKILREERDTLAASLANADSDRKQQTEDLTEVEARYGQRAKELELKLQDAEAQRITAQTALETAEKQLVELTARRGSELGGNGADLEIRCNAAEAQNAALQDALKDTESRLAELIEKYNNERGARQQSHRELEIKLQTMEAQKNAVQAALQDSMEKQHSALQDALRSTESNVSQLTEKYMAETSQLEMERKKTEQRFQAADQHRIRLQDALNETEEKLASLSEKYRAAEQSLEELERQQTEAQNTAAEFADKNLRYQRLSQYTSVGVAVADLKGYVIECNDIAARMFGYENASDAIGQTGDKRFRLYSFNRTLSERLKADGKLENIGWTFSGSGGRLVQVQEYATLVNRPDESEPVVERILMDLSQAHKRGEDIRHLRKLESAGDLAVATIKSFQELCSSLAQSSEQLLEASFDNKEAKRLAESIRIKANRGAKYADRFLSASQKMDRAPSLLNFNEILTDNNSLLQNLTGEDIDLQLALEPNLGRFAADQSEAVHLISNVMATAHESLPLGGMITIETSNIETEGGGDDEPEGLPSGPYVRVVFGIDGCAAQPERRNASIRSAVDRMGGWLITGSDSKKGNFYAVYLPRVEVLGS